MSRTQVRATTQLKDGSVTTTQLHPDVQGLIARAWKRVDFVALADQTELYHAEFSTAEQTDVYRNGVLLHPSEYAVADGVVTLAQPLTAGELVAVFHGTRVPPDLREEMKSFTWAGLSE